MIRPTWSDILGNKISIDICIHEDMSGKQFSIQASKLESQGINF